MLFLLACAAPSTVLDDALWTVCDPRELAPGELRAKRMGCTDERPERGEARRGEFLLQNSRVAATFRSPAESLSLIGPGGGTLIDYAEAGERDRLIEAIPLIEGGWMHVEEVELGVDEASAWLTLSGTSASLPNLPPVEEGLPRTFTWRLPVDAQTLLLEGADGLYLHGDGLSAPTPFGLYRGDQLRGADATGWQDLGGAIVLEGVTQLAVGSWPEVHALLHSQPVSGTCDGDQVEVWGDELLGYLAPEFDDVVPAQATHLICTAELHAPGEPTPLGQDLTLTPGAEGGLWLRATDEASNPLPVRVRVGDRAFAVPAEGDWLDLPPGRWEVQIDHGPAWASWSSTLTIEGPESLTVLLRERFPTQGWWAVDLFQESHPSWRTRGEASDDVRLAIAQGMVFTVHSAPDELGDPSTWGWSQGLIRMQAGSWTASPVGHVWSWPWSENTRQAAHGAVDWRGQSAVDVLALAESWDLPGRHTVVDTDWLVHAGDPAGWSPSPDLLRMRSLEDLDALIDLLEQGQRIGVAGPWTWVRALEVEGLPSVAEVERQLVRGHSTAGTGPILGLTLEDDALVFDARTSGLSVDRIELWEDGALIQSWSPDALPSSLPTGVQRWALLVARGQDWAVSAPLWVPRADTGDTGA